MTHPIKNYQTIKTDYSIPQVATVILNRPEVRNAFNEVAIAEITQVFAEMTKDTALRVIVLAAEGVAFCAGADLNWMKKMAGYTHTENLADATSLAMMLKTLYRCPKPVIAKIQGDCYGGAIGLVGAADIVVAADCAHFCLSEVRLGLIPATISPYVIKAMGERTARRYFLTAEKFSAHEAHRIGLVHEVATAENLHSAVDRIAQSLLANGPKAVEQAKFLVQDVAEKNAERRVNESDHSIHCSDSLLYRRGRRNSGFFRKTQARLAKLNELHGS